MSQTQIVKTTAWSAGPGCHGGCGVELHIEDGRLVKVEGDANHAYSHGRLCPRCLALTQYIYHPDRVMHPLKRVGARGEGKWEEISWDEAYDTIEERLRDIRDKYGPETVLFCQGTGRDIGGPISMLAYAYGSPNWMQLGLSGHSCYTPRLVALYATLGDYTVFDAGQFSGLRYADPEWKVPGAIIVWGQNPVAGCRDADFSHWTIDCAKRGTKLIVVDPHTTWMAGRAAIHLQLRPGTDGALALGMLNVIINEELYDRAFVNRWCVGFDELRERVKHYPPAKVAEITGVPERSIVEAARLFATSKPAAISPGVATDHCPQATSVLQAINHLWVITGNVDNPGGMVIARSSHGISTYPYSQDEIKELYGEGLVRVLNEKRIGAREYPVVKNFRGWSQEDVVIEQLESDKPYKIRGAWIQTSNPIGGQAADPKRHLKALRELDFIVVVDTFQTPTSMALADIFLPAATFAEKDILRTWWSPLSTTPKAISVGECKSDWEINLELCRRLNPESFSFASVKDFFDVRLKVAGAGVTFDEIVEMGNWKPEPEGPTKPYFRHEKGLLRPDGKPGFRTPSGKIELWSSFWEESGLDPLPYYEEPPESPVATPELWEQYPLILTTGRRSHALFHSEHRMIPWLREIEPWPKAELHPKTAATLGLIDGDWVYVENERGRVKARLTVTPASHPDVVSVMHGWWLPETEGTSPNLFSTWEHNINNLIPMGRQGRSGFGGGAYRTCLCRVTKVGDAQRHDPASLIDSVNSIAETNID